MVFNFLKVFLAFDIYYDKSVRSSVVLSSRFLKRKFSVANNDNNFNHGWLSSVAARLDSRTTVVSGERKILQSGAGCCEKTPTYKETYSRAVGLRSRLNRPLRGSIQGVPAM